MKMVGHATSLIQALSMTKMMPPLFSGDWRTGLAWWQVYPCSASCTLSLEQYQESKEFIPFILFTLEVSIILSLLMTKCSLPFNTSASVMPNYH